MRVVYDYGGATFPGAARRHIPTQPSVDGRPGPDTRRTPVVVITHRRHPADAPASESPRSATVPPSEAGAPVPGTDYVLRISDDALRRDAAVRLHERAHAASLGPYAESAIHYSTARGPAGERVVTGGRIAVDLDPVPGDPRASLAKARTVLNAALAPGDPSAADMRVAADAYRLAAASQRELRRLEIDA